MITMDRSMVKLRWRFAGLLLCESEFCSLRTQTEQAVIVETDLVYFEVV